MIDIHFKLYLTVHTRTALRNKLYPLCIIEMYENHLEEEIDIQDAIDTLDTMYPHTVDQDGNIYFLAEIITE